MKRLNCLTPFIESGKRLHPDFLAQRVQAKPSATTLSKTELESLKLDAKLSSALLKQMIATEAEGGQVD